MLASPQNLKKLGGTTRFFYSSRILAPFPVSYPYNCRGDFRSEAKGENDKASSCFAIVKNEHGVRKALVNKALMRFVTESGSEEIHATINHRAA
jgi:hypothetical protein